MLDRSFPLRVLVLLILLAMVSVSMADAASTRTEDSQGPPQAGSRRGGGRGVYKTRITPHWFDQGNRFWYRNDLAGNRREYLLVDAVEGTRGPAFDHDRLAAALRKAGLGNAQAARLALEAMEFDLPNGTMTFRSGDQDWRCDLASYELTPLKDRKPLPEQDRSALHPADAPRASTRTGPETELQFLNQTNGEVSLFWLNSGGQRQSYGQLAAGAERSQHTFAGHVWLVADAEGREMAIFQAEDRPGRAVITGQELPRRQRTRPPQVSNRETSPDGQWRAFVRDHNVFLRATESENTIQLSQDGRPGNSYEMLQWTPDSKTLIAFRVEPGERKEVFRIESSPREGGRAKLHAQSYALPGDKFTAYELNLFHVAEPEPKQIKPNVERIDFGRPRLRIRADGRSMTYEKIDRGHQRFRVIEVDLKTGDARPLIDETSPTFIWTAHAQNFGVPKVTWLENSDEILLVSEQDGWRHLYLLDSQTGETKHQITQGEFVVRGVDRIDEEHRQIWFRASGRNPDQDPYLIHYYRVNFDGGGLVALTEGDGNHSVEFSPDRRFLIDTYSRVDMPPVHELRRVSDGQLVCELEKADISELKRSGWQPPEVFSAMGRDGQTSIWGMICRPRNFDPAKKYPIIEDIYAGPQDSFVPKTFSPSNRYEALTELGFVVVKIDGMGTANRSKAFHDVCWRNLKDGGFPDRIRWIQAAAKTYPSLDASRVGIYGTSAGGQNAAAAVLFHPEFYKAAFAACGCHDNRMDKASWNEQWMGYPVGPHYADSSNIEQAHRLQGNLMLLVGEMDTNVPPESTLRFANALIKAGKDFDLIVVPGAGHGNGGSYGQRRMRDFFVRHLQGLEPPNRNKRN